MFQVKKRQKKNHLYNLDDFCDNKRICFKLTQSFVEYVLTTCTKYFDLEKKVIAL